MSIYPDSPQVAVGAVVFKQNKVLLVKRGKPPSQNEWAIPGGSVELGETLQQAAEREIYEETGIVIRAQEPIFVFDMVQKDESDKIRFHYIIIDLIAEYKSGKLLPGDDALDARWFTENEIKNPMINRMTQNLLEKYFNRPENWASNLALI
ncbi:NUDIX hydrolase [Desulfococcaceae bacterium HSG7]|nr:NUDIX hydrolase [Desulfococcaceae bacterium HSG7]